jgi:hypothetical protein
LIWSSRPNTFVAGLDANTFPGGGRQDPVLLDAERIKIHEKLPLGTDRPRDKRYDMALALASSLEGLAENFIIFFGCCW